MHQPHAYAIHTHAVTRETARSIGLVTVKKSINHHPEAGAELAVVVPLSR